MKEVLYALPGIFLTILCWGAYGEVLHKGQAALGNDRLKPLICVGLAYFVVAIIIPSVILTSAGKFSGDWTARGIIWSMSAGGLGAFGALGIILALTNGGKPVYVMPLVFGGAPIVNVIVAMYAAKISWRNDVSPLFYAGLIMVVVGAAFVLIAKPKPGKHTDKPAPVQKASVEPAAAPDQKATEEAGKTEETNGEPT